MVLTDLPKFSDLPTYSVMVAPALAACPLLMSNSRPNMRTSGPGSLFGRVLVVLVGYTTFSEALELLTLC